MSNPSLKEQLQAVASQVLETVNKQHKPKKKFPQVEKLKKPKPRWLDYLQYGVELLKVYFPECFKGASEIQPLKKGIKQDLVRRLSMMDTIVTEDKACMVKSLAYYVNTSAYHRKVIDGAIRIDLDGCETGKVSAEEAKYSLEREQAKLRGKQSMPMPSSMQNKEKSSL